MFIIQTYLENKLKELTEEQSHLGALKARKNLDQIRMLRVEATNIKGIYNSVLISASASAIRVYEIILMNSWNLNNIIQKLLE